jgi:hypothetical protein
MAKRDLIAATVRDRLAGFALTPGDRLALLFGLPALAAELLVLQGEAARFVLGVLELRLLRHDRLFLLVVLGREGRDRIRRLDDRGIERRGFGGEAGEGLALTLNPAPQFFDFALGLDPAPRWNSARRAWRPSSAQMRRCRRPTFASGFLRRFGVISENSRPPMT